MDLAFELHKHSRPPTFIRKIFQPPTYCFMGVVSKIALLRHHLKIIGLENFSWALNERPFNQPLITISNHHSCLDDFFLCGSLLPMRTFADVDKCRWSLTAVDICFTSRFYSIFFSWFRGVPVWRRVRDPKSGKIIHNGGGVYQPSINFCLNLLNVGQWLHIFPQGRIIHPHERSSEAELRLRWGVGRLIAESEQDPIIIPIWHCGLDDLNPSEVPNTGVTLSRIFGRPRCLTIGIGKPIDVSRLRHQLKCNYEQYKQSSTYRSSIHSHLTKCVQNELYELKQKTEAEHHARLKSYSNS